MAEVSHQANDLLSFQTEEPPVGMLYNSHITETRKVEVVSKVNRHICANREPLNGSSAEAPVCQ